MREPKSNDPQAVSSGLRELAEILARSAGDASVTVSIHDRTGAFARRLVEAVPGTSAHTIHVPSEPVCFRASIGGLDVEIYVDREKLGHATRAMREVATVEWAEWVPEVKP